LFLKCEHHKNEVRAQIRLKLCTFVTLWCSTDFDAYDAQQAYKPLK